ncbi:hypothetical protein LCGC14_2874150, partial [marine sediment metagenome]
ITLTGDYTGMVMDFDTNINNFDSDGATLLGISIITPLTGSASAVTTTVSGINITGGSLVASHAANVITWYGLHITMPGYNATFNTIDSFGIKIEMQTHSGTGEQIGFDVAFPTIAGSGGMTLIGIKTELSEHSIAGVQNHFLINAGSEVLSGTATYRGLYVNWSSITRDANAPVLEGIRVDFPDTITGFSTSTFAAQFTGYNNKQVRIFDISTTSFINLSFDTTTALTNTTGIKINFEVNVTALNPSSTAGWQLFHLFTPAINVTNAVNATFWVIEQDYSGAVICNNAGANVTWYGYDLRMPALTETAGNLIANGIRIRASGVTGSPTLALINLDAGPSGIGIDFSAMAAAETVFKFVADANDPTGGGGAATGRIAIDIGGSTVYLPYY